MQQAASNDAIWEIVFSMIFTVGERKIVLPRSMVSEVRSWREPDPIPQLSQQPSWLLGELVGRNERIPLISLENLLDRDKSPEKKGRVVVVNSIHPDLAKNCQKPKFGFVCSGFPTLLEVRQPDAPSTPLDEQVIDPTADNFISTEFSIGALTLAVPNFPAVEARIAALYRPITTAT